MPEAPKYFVSKRAKILWGRLTDWYGTRLTESYGIVPPKDWCEAVDEADNAAVKRALIAIRTKHATFPPTFPQFEEALKPIAVEAVTKQGPSMPYLISMWMLKTYPSLSRERIARPWTYLVRRFDAPDGSGKMRHNHGAEFVGVRIPAHGDEPEITVRVDDMDGLEAA